jgi:hypothetical protein
MTPNSTSMLISLKHAHSKPLSAPQWASKIGREGKKSAEQYVPALTMIAVLICYEFGGVRVIGIKSWCLVLVLLYSLLKSRGEMDDDDVSVRRLESPPACLPSTSPAHAHKAKGSSTPPPRVCCLLAPLGLTSAIPTVWAEVWELCAVKLRVKRFQTIRQPVEELDRSCKSTASASETSAQESLSFF